MENIAEHENLKKIYNTVDWIDLGLVGVFIFYYSRWGANLELPNDTAWNQLDYAQFRDLVMDNIAVTGIILLLISLAVCITLIYLTIKMRRLRVIGAVRAIARLFFNGFFLLLDVSFLLMLIIFFFS